MNLREISKDINFILLNILVIFVILSFMIRNLPGGSTHWSPISTEIGFIENSQLIILLYAIFLNIKKIKLIISLKKRLGFFLRLFTLIFLFYEEISFLTENKFDSMKSLNFQSELNFHLLKFLDNNFLENIRMPFLNYTFDVTISVFMFTTILFLIGFGSYFKFLSNFELVFWEKKFSFYSFVFILNIFLGSILNNLGMLKYSFLIEPELVETFIYIIFVLDTHSKIIKKNK